MECSDKKTCRFANASDSESADAVMCNRVTQGLTERELSTPFNDSLSLSGGDERLHAHLPPVLRGAAGIVKKSGQQRNRAKQTAQFLAGAVNIEDLKKAPSNIPQQKNHLCLISL